MEGSMTVHRARRHPAPMPGGRWEQRNHQRADRTGVQLDFPLGILPQTLGQEMGDGLDACRPSPDRVDPTCRKEETSLLGADARGQGPVIVVKSPDD